MRLDYILYIAAVVLFILTGIVLAYQHSMKELWTVTTFVLGLLCVALGYSQRPKIMPTSTQTPTLPSIPSVIAEKETEVEEEIKNIPETTPYPMELTEIRGIGEKRKDQLESIGIHSINELVGASVEDLAAKLEVSPKRVKAWIENAKKLVKE